MNRQTWLAAATALMLILKVHATQAEPAPTGYLASHLPAFLPPPPPSDPALVEIDLAQVRAEQSPPTSARWLEAYADAEAYNAPDIIRRFDDATGVILYEQSRPILTYVLKRVIADTSAYASVAKMAPGAARLRPYAEDSSIIACDTNYLVANQSYPSGHAMNGYVVSKILASVFPGRSDRILARGLRYGDNRVVCGVHHPTDIEQGRMLGVVYLKALVMDPAYIEDFDCVKQEDAFLGPAKAPLSNVCALKRDAIVSTNTRNVKLQQTPTTPLF